MTEPAEKSARKARNKKAQTKVRRIVVIDDLPIVRRGLAQVVSTQRGLELVAEVDSSLEAIEAIREHEPDVAVLDIALERGSGLDLIKQLRGEFEELRILVFSSQDEELYAERSLRAGADGYISKSEEPDRLVEAIRETLSGATALSPEMTERLVQQALSGNGEPTGVDSLSDRELEVFQKIGAGLSTRKIAKQLCISVKTVETHRENIKRKLDIDSAAELARYAVAWVENPS